MRNHNLIEDLKSACKKEGVNFKHARRKLLRGEILVTSSKRGIEPLALGAGFRKKFAVIVGTSSGDKNISKVIRKARLACAQGASMVHDGSTAGDIGRIRRALIRELAVPIAFSHPVGAIAQAAYKDRGVKKVTEEELIERIEYDIDMGAEILVIPAAATAKLAGMSLKSGRLMPCVSKCGSLMVSWMLRHQKENPYYKYIDKIFKIAKDKNTTICLLTAFRPGCIADAFDNLQMAELKIIKELVKKAHQAGVQVEAGLGGHLPLNRISGFFSAQKQLLKTPIIAFGPQVTDTAAGSDHIDASIGQGLAMVSGADAFFVITPAEHLGMPQEKDVIEGCAAARIVCHAANISYGKDTEVDLIRAGARARGGIIGQCSICGNYCALKTMRNILQAEQKLITNDKLRNNR